MASADGTYSDFGAAYARLVESGGEASVLRMLDNLNGLIATPSVLGFAATGKLRGAEKRAFQEAAIHYLESTGDGGLEGDGDLPAFDLLSPFQRVAVVAELAVGLLVAATPLPSESLENHCGFQAVFLHLLARIERECDVDYEWGDGSDYGATEVGEEGDNLDELVRDMMSGAGLFQTEGEGHGGGGEECLKEEGVGEVGFGGESVNVVVGEDVVVEAEIATEGEGKGFSDDKSEVLGAVKSKALGGGDSKCFSDGEGKCLGDGEALVQACQRIAHEQSHGRPSSRVADTIVPGTRRVSRKTRARGASKRKATAPARIENLSGEDLMPDPETEMERLTKMMNSTFCDSEDDDAENGADGRQPRQECDVEGCTCGGLGPGLGVVDDRGDRISEEEDERRVKRQPYRYHWRTLLHDLIMERHAANPLLNGNLVSELHVAAQSTVCPPKTCVDLERWVHAHRMVLGAGFHVERKEAYLSTGALDMDAVARGDAEAVRRLDIISRRIDQKGREFSKTWSPEKSLFNVRTIVVLCSESVPLHQLDTSALGQLEKALIDGKILALGENYHARKVVKLLWRRRFASQMEGKQYSNLHARYRALKRVMDSERALGLHDIVWPYHSFHCEFGSVHSQDQWMEWSSKHRPWRKKPLASRCMRCNVVAKEGEKFSCCSKCSANYCSRECQVADWKHSHKLVCAKWAEELSRMDE